MSTRRKWILIAIVCIAMLLFVGISGPGFFRFNQYRASVVPVYPALGHPRVSINGPAQSSHFSQGAPIVVEVTAFNSQEISSIELYVDGELTGVESAPAGGSSYFPAEFLWSPPAPGVYSLIGRANGIDQLSTYSSPVQIVVTPPEYDSQAQDTTDNSMPVPPQAYTLPELPASDRDINPAEEWHGTLGDWINSLTAASPPNAPELVASLDGCSVNLSIHDLSDNEEGFEVWRLLPNSPSWAMTDILASQSPDEWIAYTDPDAHGGTSYYVSAFNSKGTRDSNLVSVNLDPVDCAPPSYERSVLTLTLESLETHIPVDRLYCYVSLGGRQWMRRPESGFWTREDAAQVEGFVDVEILSLNLTDGDGDREPEINPQKLYLQCWGWQADSLHYLGEISPSPLPSQPGSYPMASEGNLAEVVLSLEVLPDRPEFYPMGRTGEDDYEFGVFEDEIQALEAPWFESTVDPTMPYLGSMIAYSPESCKSHLPPPFQNPFGQFLFCTPYPGFDLGTQGVNPQPYFIWDAMPDMCMDGMGVPPCKPYPYWLSLAADLGHEVGFNVYDRNEKGFYIHRITAPELFNLVVPVVPCSGLREFWVQMWYYDGSSLMPTFGPPSSKSSIDCPEKIWPKMYLDITFNELKLSNVDDGESEPQDVEVYGYLRASSESMTRYLNLAFWNEQPSQCPDDSIHFSLGTHGAMGCPKVLSNGTYNLAEVSLSEADSYDPWQEVVWGFDNNTIRLIIEEYDSLTLSVKIVDWDDASLNDLVCQGSMQIPSRSIFEWYKVKDQEFAITTSITDSGACQIKGILNAVGP